MYVIYNCHNIELQVICKSFPFQTLVILPKGQEENRNQIKEMFIMRNPQHLLLFAHR